MSELPMTAEERLAELERKVNMMWNGGGDLLGTEGYLQIGNSNLIGAMRLDREGLQMNVRGTGGVSFVDGLRPEPGTAAPIRAQLQGDADDSTGEASVMIAVTDIDPPTADVVGSQVEVLTNGGDIGRVVQQVFVDSSLAGGSEWSEAWLNRVFGQDAGTFMLWQALLRLCPQQGNGYDFTSDPANAIEGDIWYNTTDNKFKGVDASATKAFLMEGDVSSGPTVKVKEADETVTTNTTLQNDNELLFAVGVNEVWQFEGELFLTAPAAADFKMTFTGPAGAVGSFGAIYHANGAASAGDADGGALGTSISLILTGDGRIVRFWGGIHNGGTGGDLTLQWAQDTSSGSTLLLAGSYIKYQQANV